MKIQFNLTPPQSFLDLPVHGGSFNRYHLSIVDYGSISLQIRNVSAFTLDFSGNLSFDNFSKLFLWKLIIGTWLYEHLGYRHYHHDCTNKYRYLRRLRIQPFTISWRVNKVWSSS